MCNTNISIIKQDEPKEGDVYTCTHPSVMNGTMFCDGNCWNCGYHQKKHEKIILNVPNKVIERIKSNKMMTLDEAIQHCKDVAGECARKEGVESKCIDEHYQLAAWLQELKERREADKEKEQKEPDKNRKFVSFETAKKLHDFGFYSEDCIAIYDLTNDDELVINSMIFDDGPDDYLTYNYGNEWKRFGYYLAPTLDDVIRWLREEHKLLIVVDFYGRNLGERWQYEYRISTLESVKPQVGEPLSVNYGTAVRYEKACDEAIRKCLEYLEKKVD